MKVIVVVVVVVVIIIVVEVILCSSFVPFDYTCQESTDYCLLYMTSML